MSLSLTSPPRTLQQQRFASPATGSAALPLFLLVNAALFLRPAEIVSSLEALPIYQALNVLCIVACLGQLVGNLSSARFSTAPITACVLGLCVCAVLSHLSHFDFGSALGCMIEYAKLIVYYLLLITVINSPQKLSGLLSALLWFTCVLTVVSLLQYHGVIDVDALKQHREQWLGTDVDDSGPIELVRLCGAGIFGNPNDLSRVLAIAMLCGLWRLTSERTIAGKLLWMLPLTLMGYAFHLTNSRGGLLALTAGLLVLFRVKLKGFRFYMTVAAVLAFLVMAYSGRQLDITTESGTGQQRIQLWLEGFSLLWKSPIFGIGMGNFVDQIGLVAHNSFVQCFVEMGLVGGTLFAGAFYLAWWEPYSFTSASNDSCARQLVQLRPCILAIVASAIIGMLSSTRSYSLPTYLVLGLAAAYVRMVEPFAATPQCPLRRHVLRRMCMMSGSALIVLYVYARISVIWKS